MRVQTRPYLQRPNWRAVARALGPAPCPRAILASDGTTADPLKIYLPGVRWTQPAGDSMLIREVDVVGADQGPPAAAGCGPLARALRSTASILYPTGSSVPRQVAPPGARLEARFRVDNWVVARFALRQPLRISAKGL